MKRNLMMMIAVLWAATLMAQPLSVEEKVFFDQQMSNQAKSWNMGDVDGFMSYYWGSDSLLFVTGGQVRRGWQNIRDSYEKKYPGPEAMGTLEYSHLYFYKIDKKTVFCTGSWALVISGERKDGTFTLIWKKIKNRWVITMDHTE